jgi:Sulfotransferase family
VASNQDQEDESPCGARVPKVVYVLGAGRSGSTILGVALGNCEGFFFAGELNKWLPRRGAPSLDDAPRVEFWRRVREQLPSDSIGPSGARFSSLERSSALFHPRAWRVRRTLRQRYRRVAEDLYRAIAKTTGAEHIVDTSHYPLRARELQSLTGIELHIIFLVRDPQSVVASLGREDVVERSFGTLTTNAYLLLTHLLSLWVFLAHPRERRMLVRHEDLRADPERTLREILDHIGSDARTPDIDRLRTGVALHGNRLIRKEVVALERGADERARVSTLTRLLQFPSSVVLSRLRPAVGPPPRRER